MIGRRLRSGFYAVPVLRAELLRRTGEWTSVWCIELECGHVLDEHRSWTGTRAPRWAGCPHGCGAEIGRVRRELKAKFDGVEAAQRAEWARARASQEARWAAARARRRPAD